jgi:acyl-CoA dehydrogenase
MKILDTEETAAITDALLRFIDREVVPIEAANQHVLKSERTIYDEDGRHSEAVLALRRQVRMRSAELGFYNLFGAEEIGGGGLGAQASLHIQEAVNAHCGPSRTLVQTVVLPSPFTNGLSPILNNLEPATLALYREGIASGAKTLCFGLSEPDAGSDVYGMKTRALKDGDHWVLSGTKQWITNAPHADYAMVFAVTDEEQARKRKGGITGFFIDTRTTGFAASGVIPVMGHLGGDTGIITLDNVQVRDDHRLSPVNRGLSVAISGVNVGRLGMAGMCVGLARWALDQALAYSKVRRTFDQPICEHQAIQIMLANCAMDIYAAKSMAQRCAQQVDQGAAATKETSMTKAFCTEMLNRVMDQCIQIHGAMGLTNELRLEQGYRMARILKIPDGTAEIQRRTIAKCLLAGDTDL